MNLKNLFLLFILSVYSSIAPAMNFLSDKSLSKVDIYIGGKNANKNTEIPRSPAKSIFTCYYEDGNIYLNVPFELGVIDVTIQNLSTGETWNYSWDSEPVWVCFPASDMEGEYVIEIETESHGDYIGYYDL